MASFEQAIPKILAREGGDRLTTDPDDPGGMTKYGIAKASHPHVDIANLTQPQAEAIYRSDYWDKLGGDMYTNQTVAEMLFDAAVNMGVGRVLALAGTVLRCPPTVNDVRMSASRQPSQLVVQMFTLARLTYYIELCERRPQSRKYLFGWARRALEASS